MLQAVLMILEGEEEGEREGEGESRWEGGHEVLGRSTAPMLVASN